MQGPGSDFTHIKTLNGKVTTVDLRDCAIPHSSHIKTDARKFVPKNKIKHLIFELFPSFDTRVNNNDILKKLAEDDTNFDALTLMSDTIRNQAPHMDSGAILEIEHIPHILFFSNKLYKTHGELLLQKNPFMCIISPYYFAALKNRNIDVNNTVDVAKLALSVGISTDTSLLVLLNCLRFNKKDIDHVKRFVDHDPGEIEKRIDDELNLCAKEGLENFLANNAAKQTDN